MIYIAIAMFLALVCVCAWVAINVRKQIEYERKNTGTVSETDHHAAALASIRDALAEDSYVASGVGSANLCDGCGHLSHPAWHCVGYTLNERCECDEPLSPGDGMEGEPS